MPIKEKIIISDEGITTLKKIRDEHKSFRDELKSTKADLKSTWDKRYKPAIETSGAYKSIQSLQNKAVSFKDSLKSKINIDDSHIQKLNDAKSKMKAFGKMVVSPIVMIKDSSKKAIDSLYSKLIKIGKTVVSPVVKLKDQATAKVIKLKTEASRLGKIIVRPAVALKDSITSKLSSINSKLSGLAGKKVKATITAIDKTASGIGSAMKKIGSVAKKIAIPIAVVATVTTAALGASVNAGMKLENQQISIKHFIGATNKDYTEGQINEAAQSFTDALRTNANATPFETGEVIQAGSRAIAITQGNTTSAMSLVKLAEDMAAASGGTKSVGDAMEALADAKLGEMERLKEFGFKVSADDFSKKGFEGVSKDLEDFYGGAAGKLASSGSGLLSTITGKLKSGVADFGLKIVDKLKPVFTNIIGFIDKIMPYIDEFGTAFGESLGEGITAISQMIPGLLNGFKQMMPALKIIITGIQQMMPPIMAFGSTIVTTIQNIIVQATPVIATIVSAISRILPAIQPIFSLIVTAVGNIVTSVLPALGSAFTVVADVVTLIAPVVTSVFGGILEFITGAVSGISSIIQGGLDLISSIWSGDWQGMVDSFGTILGGIGEICKAPINAVIGILNGAIEAINSVSIDTPDWLPFGWGGQHLGFDLGKIDYLAKGGIVNKATPAIVGEAGKEAVMPLERNTGWISQLASQIGSFMGGMSFNVPKLSNTSMPFPVNQDASSGTGKSRGSSIVVTIAKLADQIIVRDKEDIDDIADEVAKKILEVCYNM